MFSSFSWLNYLNFCLTLFDFAQLHFIVPHLPTTRSARGGVMELVQQYCDCPYVDRRSVTSARGPSPRTMYPAPAVRPVAWSSSRDRWAWPSVGIVPPVHVYKPVMPLASRPVWSMKCSYTRLYQIHAKPHNNTVQYTGIILWSFLAVYCAVFWQYTVQYSGIILCSILAVYCAVYCHYTVQFSGSILCSFLAV